MMPVPPFADFWLPVLRHLSDGRVYRPSDLVNMIADGFGLSDEDRADRIASGRTRVLDRVLWTITYFRQAGLVASSKRGEVHITDRGHQLLADHPDRITKATLLRYPEFQSFVSRSRRDRTDGSAREGSPLQNGQLKSPVKPGRVDPRTVI